MGSKWNTIFFISSTLLLVLSIPMSLGYVQELILYESNATDTNIFTFHKHVPDVTKFLGDVPPSAICVSGIWVGYTETNFEGQFTLLTGLDDTSICIEGSQSGQFKSFRFGGSFETTQYSISFYTEYDFGGRETVVTVPADSIVTGKSFIFTGPMSWSLYDKEDFFGNATCVQPNDAQGGVIGVYSYGNVTSTFGFAQIKSTIRRVECPAMSA